MVSISQTKKLKIEKFDVSRTSNVEDKHDFGSGHGISLDFTLVLVSKNTTIDLCSNIKYLKNLEELVFSLPVVQDVSDLSFLELPKLKKLAILSSRGSPHTYIGKNPIRIPNIDKTIDVSLSGLTIVTE